MEKCFGAEERHDQLIVLGTGKCVLVYGHGEEDGQGFDYRHRFDRQPTATELLKVITEHVDSLTDQKILTGFRWHGKNVWLSAENQRNFSEGQRAAMITNGASLPVTFKIGEDAQRSPVYHEFTTVEELTAFYLEGVAFINQCLVDGWREKDAAREWVENLEL